MKHYSPCAWARFLLIVAFVSGFIGAQITASATDVFEQNRKLGRGVNIIGYDGIWRDRATARFKADYFRKLHEAGFNNVRINLHPFGHMTDASGKNLKPQWWEVADWAVTNALANGLVPILDCHEYNAMGQDAEGNKARYLGFWQAASEHFKNAPDTVMFELLNEPNKKMTPELWNQYLSEALAIVRRTNPTRTVIIGPTSWNSINALNSLRLPADDHNIIVTVHYYTPMSFTHQGAPFIAEYSNKTGVSWMGTDAEKAAVAADFAKAAKWAKENNRPIFLGEFGAYDKADMDSRARYVSHVARTAESLGWSWAYWQFDSDFVLYRIDSEAWVEPLRKALVPSKQ